MIRLLWCWLFHREDHVRTELVEYEMVTAIRRRCTRCNRPVFSKIVPHWWEM
jgi:hypothetical protein